MVEQVPVAHVAGQLERPADGRIDISLSQLGGAERDFGCFHQQRRDTNDAPGVHVHAHEVGVAAKTTAGQVDPIQFVLDDRSRSGERVGFADDQHSVRAECLPVCPRGRLVGSLKIHRTPPETRIPGRARTVRQAPILAVERIPGWAPIFGLGPLPEPARILAKGSLPGPAPILVRAIRASWWVRAWCSLWVPASAVESVSPPLWRCGPLWPSSIRSCRPP